MELYNSTIRELTEKLGGYRTQSWGYEPAKAWKDLGQNELVLTRDAAFELGGGSNPASNCTCVCGSWFPRNPMYETVTWSSGATTAPLPTPTSNFSSVFPSLCVQIAASVTAHRAATDAFGN